MKRTVSILFPGLAFVAAFAAGPALGQASSANYTFATSTAGTFTDMSSGTTQLVGALQDDTSSAVTNIGFEFIFMGARNGQFSASSNGAIRLGGTAVSNVQYTLGTAGIPLIAGYASDLETHSTGKVHYKVTGSAPNRVLTIEFLNETLIWDPATTSPDGTYQVRLSESSGFIELLYGPMKRNTSTTANAQFVGFSTSNAANTFATVTTATNAVATSGAVTSNLPPLNTVIANLNSPVEGSRRTYSFTPPGAPNAPTALNFTGTTAFSTTLNWTDNSANELGFVVYRSTDGGTTYSFVAQTAANAITFTDSTLAPATTYFYQVVAVSEGAPSAPATNNVSTSPPGNITSAAGGGLWSAAATWSGGTVPTSADNVTIVDGATVTVDTAAVALSLNVGSGGAPAILVWEPTTARTLTVGSGGVTISSNGAFQSAASGTVVTHNLSVSGSLTNNGILDFSTNGNTAGATITFTGAANTTFSGSGPTTDIRQIALNKGTSAASIVELMTTNFTVRGSTADVASWLVFPAVNGTLKLSGTFAGTSRVFPAAAYTTGPTGGFWLNNPNYMVAGQNGSPQINGLFRVSQGTLNVGTSANNSLGFATGATVVIEGGAVNVTGRFGVNAAGNVIGYTQSGGTITVCTAGNISTTLASFDLGNAAASAISMSGGTIVVQLPNTAPATPRDYRNQAGTGITGVTGGTLQLGNAASGAAKAFTIVGVLPNLVLTNTSGNHTATFAAPAVFNNISLNITINAGNTLDFGNQVFLFDGTTLTNNGTLTHNGASSNFVWFNVAAPVSYVGSGTITVPITAFSMQANLGLTLDPAGSSWVTNAVRLFSGSVIYSNKITLGTGGASTGVLQIGNTTTPTPAGTFDVPLTFNLGTGGQTISYLRTAASRSTGPEVNPTRTLTALTFDDNDVTHTLTVAGGDVNVNGAGAGALALTNGRIITGANTLYFSNTTTGTVTRTTGFVDGSFKKAYAAAGSKTFELGTANGYVPFIFNATAGTFPTDVTVKETQGPLPGLLPTATALLRYWTLTATGVTASLTFNYLDPTDIPVTATEANFKLFRHDMGVFTDVMGTVTPATNQATVTGITIFSDWTLAESAIQGPTATVTGDATICQGGSTMISAALTGTPPWDIMWSDGVPQLGVAMSPATRTVSPALTTVYTVTTVSDANGAGTASGSATVTVIPTPPAPTAGSNSPICAGQDLNLTASTVPGATYAWTGPSGFVSGAQNPTILGATTAATGMYSVTATVSGCPSAPGMTAATVNAPPTTASAGGPQTLCPDVPSAPLGGNTPVIGAGAWSVVSGGTGTFSSVTDPNATFDYTGGAGPIVVRWTISNPPCTASTFDVTLTLETTLPVVTAPADATVTQTLCQ